MYLTYLEYRQYGGTLDEIAYSLQEYKARKAIDTYTFNRVQSMKEIPEAVKYCMVELINTAQIHEQNIKTVLTESETDYGGRLLSSFSNDGYTESYANSGANIGEYITLMEKSGKEAQLGIIRKYLTNEYDDNNVALLYRGVV